MLINRPVQSLLLRRGLYQTQLRFNSSKENKPKQNNDKSSEVSKRDDAQDVQRFKIKQTTSKSAPAPMESTGIEQLMKKNNKPYIPKFKHQRVTFEYPDLPNEDQYNNLNNKPKRISRWTRYIPKILTVIGVAWAGYTIKVWYLDDPEEGQDSNELLDPNEFHKFIVTHKEQIDDDHYIIELKSKYDRWEYSFATNPDKKSLWNGDHIWSVEIKQPDINVVRSYTPLPMYYMKSEYTRSGEKKPLLKILNPEVDDLDKNGTMCLYVKRYKQGEVSRYITDREIGDELELRGPTIEYKFPYHPLKKIHQRPIFKDLASKVEPDNLIESIKRDSNLPDVDNLNFYAAGTGIAPILQVLFSKNPYMGYVNIHYSAQKPGEIGILSRFLLFLNKLDRVNINHHFDSEPKTILTGKDISLPAKSSYYSPKKLDEATAKLSPEEALNVRIQAMKDEEEMKSEKVKKLVQSASERGERFETGLEQAMATATKPKKPAALAIVCGPDGYVEYVSGPKDLVRKAQGPITGLLGEKKWDNSNVYKL
ncbi:Cyc2 protein [Candida orthopsilosis Co 90-125]|uniref:Cyc2 protein n=1 Tax=Candida orthopsilosis (strain 90-125) TaxID=1136231 RepID=H8X822_CANO9|nr:Cyc2 protein [Candida orthopsilosis Co 90-125]CCG24121.1 Cyc2 protein [Candida orthopsilosis Co 90-125]